MEAKSAAGIAYSRWGTRGGQPVGLLHLSEAISRNNVPNATRLLDGLRAWGRNHGYVVDDIDDILDEVIAGRGKEAASRFLSDYDRAASQASPEMGRPPMMDGGKRRNIYLDEATAEAAKLLGGGNLSEGLRRAVDIATKAGGQ